MNYARCQQYRRLSRAGPAAAGAAAVAMLGLWLASMGATSIAGLLLLLAIGLGLHARHWLVLAGRSRVGARSEDEVRRALARLETEGWRRADSWLLCRPLGLTGKGRVVRRRPRTAGVT